MIALLTLAAAVAVASPTGYPEVRTDPRFELFGVVQLLAGAEKRYSGFHRYDIPYTRAAERWFKPFARHPCIEVYQRLAATGLDYIVFNDFIYNLGDPPALLPRRHFEPGNLPDAYGSVEMEEFRLLLADFARVSRFEAYFKETASLRAAMVSEVAQQAVALDLKSRLERYTGMPVGLRYTLIVSPFVEPSLSSTWIREEVEGRRLTSLYGPEELPGRVGFRLPTRLGALWTEILMGQLDLAARPYRERLKGSEALYASLGNACAANWPDCVGRHVSFAVGTRMLDLAGEHETAREWPIKYARIGLPYIGALAERLREFEADRTRYPTLMDFYPRLISELEALARRDAVAIPFQGGVRAILSDPAARTIILPSAESAGIGSALRRLARDRWKEAQYLTDEEALASDLKGRTLIVLGTAAGNRWLGRHLGALQLPLRFEGSKLVFDSRPGEKAQLMFEGELGLITAAVNPIDSSKGLLLYTAVESRLLPALVGAYDGPVDFVVLSASATVKLGSYEKTRRPWRLK